MKKIRLFIFFITIMFFLNCPIIFAKTTPNGVSILEEEFPDNNFSIICRWYGPNNEDYELSINRKATAEDGTGGVRAGNAAYFLPNASNETLKSNIFMYANGSLDCPLYIRIDKNDSKKIIGFGNKLEGPQDYISYGLKKSESSCIGICENLASYVENKKKEEDENQGFIEGELTCRGIFKGEFGKILKQIIDIMRFLVPILILGLSVVDFIKALAAQNQDEVKKASQKFIKRIIIGIVIFLLPTILEFLLNIAGIEYGICPLGE